MNFLLEKIREHLILPFQETEAPIPRVAWGAAIGVFVGLTPTMGVQMYIVGVVWIVCRYLFRLRFNLPIAVAMVWISNPVTVVPFLWVYLLCGDWLLQLLGWAADPRDYHTFLQTLKSSGGVDPVALGTRLQAGFLLVFWTYGWPILIGSLMWAIPLSVATYPVTAFALLKYRWLRASREGLSYREWRERHITRS